MNKLNLNFIIDILLLGIMSAMIGIGFLIKYILLTGQEKWIKYGANLDQTFWGLDRHQWGDIHLWLGIAFIVLLVLHIVFHWKQIVCMFQRFFGQFKLKSLVTTLFLLMCLLFIITPFFIEPEMQDVKPGYGHFGRKQGLRKHLEPTQSPAPEVVETPIPVSPNVVIGKDEPVSPPQTQTPVQSPQKISPKEAVHEPHAHDRTLNIRGYMTIQSVCRKYGISDNHLKQSLKLPADLSNQTRLSYLRRHHNIRMHDVEQLILDYQKTK